MESLGAGGATNCLATGERLTTTISTGPFDESHAERTNCRWPDFIHEECHTPFRWPSGVCNLLLVCKVICMIVSMLISWQDYQRHGQQPPTKALQDLQEPFPRKLLVQSECQSHDLFNDLNRPPVV